MPDPNLAAEICKLFKDHHASRMEGDSALMLVLVPSLMDGGLTKDRALEMIGEVWDTLEPMFEAHIKAHLDA